jgi:hypothetical protein
MMLIPSRPRLGGLLLLPILCIALAARGDGPGDNHPENVRRMPKPGIELPAAERASITAAIADLDAAIAPLASSTEPQVQELLPDVLIHAEAVRTALEFDEFFNPKEFDAARELLAEGKTRASELAAGRAPWTTQTGLVVRGYRSRIDGSIQHYGLVIPPGYVPGPLRWRLDLWFHGRGETLSELAFLGADPEDPYEPRRTAAGVARSWSAHRLGRSRAGP